MSFELFLKNTQPIVYKTFLNSLNNNHVSHAYLIKGNKGSPLLETSLFLAKTLLCEERISFACEHCFSCIRFDNQNYPDFKLINGEEKNIKLSDIENLQKEFKSTSNQKAGKLIYIIHVLENSNQEVLNALLKFLEEPQDNIYAFLTTYNEEKLLPTILSRAQHLKLLPLKKEELIIQATSNGLSQDDAEILSNFYGNVETLLNVGTGNTYIKIKDLVFDTIDALKLSSKDALFFAQDKIIPFIKDKQSLRMYLDILSLVFKSILNLKLNLPILLPSQEENILTIAKKYINVDKIYQEILLTRGKIELNVNIGLLIEHIFIYIYQGGN